MEGLFAQNLKKIYCTLVKQGIITLSQVCITGYLHILARRDSSLKVVIYPTAVQGKEATAEIVQMIELANVRQEVDVLIVGRGGGSLGRSFGVLMKKKWSGDFSFNLPIISAVGHETDVT